MRIARALDRYFAQMELERDWTPRSLQSYANVLSRLCDDPPRGFGQEIRLTDLDSRDGSDRLREHIARNWGRASSTTRSKVISYHHSFFRWAFEEGFIETDPSARIKRPPRRRPDVYRPPAADQDIAYRATTTLERAAWILMNDVGLRNATVLATKWEQVDLTHGRISVRVKGGHTLKLPLGPIALERLQAVYRDLDPDPDDHVFTIERHVFAGNRRLREVRDPKQPASANALRNMVARVCKRAGVKPFGPHALRHGFANRFLHDSERDTFSLKGLMGHAKLATTEQYLDELTIDQLEDALRRANERRLEGVTSDATVDTDGGDEASRLANALMAPGGVEPPLDQHGHDQPGGTDPGGPDDPRITEPKGGHKL